MKGFNPVNDRNNICDDIVTHVNDNQCCQCSAVQCSVSQLHSVSVVTSTSVLKDCFFNDGPCEADQIHDDLDVASPDCVNPAVDLSEVLSAAVDAPAVEIQVRFFL